mgnify:CR=1 FL=1
MVPTNKKQLRDLVSQTTIETYEELTPQLVQLRLQSEESRFVKQQ